MIKLCECGCGLPAPIAKKNLAQRGWVKGQPLRIIRGHAMGKYETDRSLASAKERECRRRYKAKIKAQGRAYVHEYLSHHLCIDCGEPDPMVLDFDHRNPQEKIKSIADLIGSQHASIKRLEAEIAKCDVRCANCHRRKHFLDKSAYCTP